MGDYNKTTLFSGAVNKAGSSLVTVFDGISAPYTVQLNNYGKSVIYFGRDSKNDIVLTSRLVSSQHGRFVYKNHVWVMEDKAVYADRGSTNGLIYNNSPILSHPIGDGDFIRIDDGIETIEEGVLFVFSATDSANKWYSMSIAGRMELTIGREEGCDITLPHVSVSKYHAKIVREKDGFYIIDNKSMNGVIVNNRKISGKTKLHEKDVIVITNSKLIFTSMMVAYCYYKSGISVDVANAVIVRGKGKKATVTSNDVSIHVKPGELVAIVGGSGAGKSTILNCMCGYLQPQEGDVYINGINLYQNFDSIKKLIGYVPQSDIVYDNLTLYDMLSYTAKLRLPKDISRKEREEAIDRAIQLVELKEKKDSFIKRLSGGQRKRASIAVELLSDPNLLFLDEPASGLDPGTERNLMQSLRKMADNGKTVILVTHSTLQLELCDKIAFMGTGGNLCFLGSYEEALRFFGMSNVVDIYNLLNEHAMYWRNKYDKTVVHRGPGRLDLKNMSPLKSKKRFQLPVLCSRYMKLVINDRQRLLLLLLQAPALALLISLVADGQQFVQYEMTKSLLFALSCSAFWVGMLNAIQEVCKERNIMKREFMTGLSLNAYVFSKILVLGLLCLIQSALIISVFAMAVGLPDKGLIIHPFVEVFLTTFFTAIASTAMGLFVSSLFTNADRAMTLAPILLMPQILFSGLIFKLKGATELISWVAVCRWSMEGYGTTANLNQLELKLQQEGVQIPHEYESFFKATTAHIIGSWLILLLFVVIFLILARFVLGRISKEKS